MVTIQVEDFATLTDIIPLSSVPLQFVVNVFKGNGINNKSNLSFH